eukprot:130768-Chlamydomonas_euryale.AAC.2
MGECARTQWWERVEGSGERGDGHMDGCARAEASTTETLKNAHCAVLVATLTPATSQIFVGRGRRCQRPRDGHELKVRVCGGGGIGALRRTIWREHDASGAVLVSTLKRRQCRRTGHVEHQHLGAGSTLAGRDVRTTPEGEEGSGRLCGPHLPDATQNPYLRARKGG